MYGLRIISHPEGEYMPDLDCILHLTVSDNYIVNITFEKFDLEPRSIANGKCRDYVQFYNGHGTEMELTETLCGDVIPSSIFSNTSNITLRYRTDGSIQRTGFTFLYNRLHRSKMANVGLVQSSDGRVFHHSQVDHPHQIVPERAHSKSINWDKVRVPLLLLPY